MTNKFGAMLASNLNPEATYPPYQLDNPHWFASQKVDGERLLVVANTTGYLLLNRNGDPSRVSLPSSIQNSLNRLDGLWLLDGEYVDGHYHVFDCVLSPTGVTPDMRFDTRYEHLSALMDLWEPEAISLLPLARTTEDKAAMVKRLREHHAEGIIFRLDAMPYRFNYRSIQMIKWKFWKSEDVILYNWGREGKLSCDMGVFDHERPRNVGSVKIPEEMLSYTEPKVAEVKFLYATAEGKLYQPSVLRLRTDKRADECTFDQILPHITNKKVISFDFQPGLPPKSFSMGWLNNQRSSWRA